MVCNVPGSRLSSTSFTKFWVSLGPDGLVAVGSGNPHPSTVCCQWKDEDPIPNIRFVGLSAWDTHIGYRNIKITSKAIEIDAPFATMDTMHPGFSSLPAVHSPVKSNGEPMHATPSPPRPAGNPCPPSSPLPHPRPPRPPHTTDPSPTTAVTHLPSLFDLCCQEALLAIQSPDNVCSVIAVADTLAPLLDHVRLKAIEAAADCLPDIIQCDPQGFQGLTVSSLAEILQHQGAVCGEKALFDALVMWANGTDTKGVGLKKSGSSCSMVGTSLSTISTTTPTMKKRSLESVESLLPHVRFPLMLPDELAAVEAHPLHTSSSLLRELVAEARRGGMIERAAASVRADRLVRELSPQEAAATARFQRRSPHGCTPLIYLYDGDKNGVFWHIGTRYGTQKWVNPALAGLLTVTASSPIGRGTNPRALLSGAFLRTNFAAPKREIQYERPSDNGTSSGSGNTSSTGSTNKFVAWWEVDLGLDHQLECNYYTLRADGSGDFLRNWCLQGSKDGVDWVELTRHEGDATFTLPGQYASWPVVGAAATIPYRRFRVCSIDHPNASSSTSGGGNVHAGYKVYLSYMELYGNFYHMPRHE